MNPWGPVFVPPERLSIGPFSVYLYSLFLLVGIVAGYYLARPEAKRRGISAERLQVSLLYGVVPGLIGARLYHVIDRWDLYAAEPLQALAIWNGGLAIFGGLAGGAFGLWLFARHQQRNFLTVLDVWAPGVLAAQAIGRLGNWANQEAFGPPTDAPWGVFIDELHRPSVYSFDTHFHPAFLYESALAVVGILVLLQIRKRFGSRPGTVLGAYLITYGIIRFVVEFFRFDTAETLGIATAHIIAVAIAGLGVALLLRPSGRRKAAG